MQILQTIWTALKNENEILTDILGVPSMVLETTIFMLYVTLILGVKATKKAKIRYVLIVSFLGIISRFLIPTPYGTYLNLLFIIGSIVLIFKVTIFKAFLGLIVPFLLTSVIESAFAKFYYIIFNQDYSKVLNLPLQRFVITTIICIILYLIYLCLKYFKSNFSQLEIVDKKKKTLLILNVVTGVILISTQVYMITFYVSTIPFLVTAIALLSLIVYLVFSIYTIFTVSKLEKTSLNLEEAQLYNKTLEILQDNTRAFRHDFANIVQGMQGYIIKNDMDGLKKYYNQLVEDIQVSNNLTTLSPKVVNNPAIYNVLASKYHKADSLGIKIHLEAFMDLNELHTKIYDFTRVIGILMDNAIEACKECDEKIINVTFRNDTKKHIQLLIIENTYCDKSIDTEKIYEKGFSTKEGNSGLGLWEIRQILKKNNNLNLYTTKNDEFFSQQFEIYY